jgi:peptidoglycan-N-acetylglucosamine deacetylase
MKPDPSTDRERAARRRAHRRKALQTRLLRQRLSLAAIAAMVTIVVVGVSLGHERGTAEVSAEPAPTPISALEHNRRHADRQERALDQVLGYTEFLRAGRPTRRRVALTFDDGPGPYTDEILRILRRHDAPATFFVLGNMLDSFPRTVRMLLREGHAVGSHSFGHPHMGQMSLELQASELRMLEQAMEEHGIPAPRIFRPPYGSFNKRTVEILDQRRSLMVLWSIDSSDYLNPGADLIVERALQGIEPGSVVLLHDGGGDRSQTIAALPRILKGLERRNLQPVTVPELLVGNPPPRRQTLGEAEAVPPPGEG